MGQDKTSCARPSLGGGNHDVEMGSPRNSPVGRVPPGKADHRRNRVLRHRGDPKGEAYTGSVWAALLSHEISVAGADMVMFMEGNTGRPRVVGPDGPAGVRERSTHTRAVQEPGRPPRHL